MRILRSILPASFAAAAWIAAGCSGSDTVTGPSSATGTPVRSPTPSSTPTPVPFSGTFVGTGNATWTSIDSARTLCSFLTSQVGSTYRTDFQVTIGPGTNAAVRLTHDPSEGYGTFLGTLAGDAIDASYAGPFGGLACPEDTAVTPQTGGELHAVWDGTELSGEYTEVYGSGPDVVTLHFSFRVVLTPH